MKVWKENFSGGILRKKKNIREEFSARMELLKGIFQRGVIRGSSLPRTKKNIFSTESKEQHQYLKRTEIILYMMMNVLLNTSLFTLRYDFLSQLLKKQLPKHNDRLIRRCCFLNNKIR